MIRSHRRPGKGKEGYPHGYTTNRKIHAALFVVLDESRKERYESMIRAYHSDYPDAKFEFRSA